MGKISQRESRVLVITGALFLGLRLSPIFFRLIDFSHPLIEEFRNPVFLIVGAALLALGLGTTRLGANEKEGKKQDLHDKDSKTR